MLHSMATIGYTTIGGSVEMAGSASSTANPTGLLITMPSDGLISKITAYVFGSVDTQNMTCSIYAGSAGSRGSLIATTNTSSVTTTPAWVDFSFASTISVTNGTTYWLQFNSYGGHGPGTNFGEINYDTGGGANTSYLVNDLGSPVYGSKQYSMYATYILPVGGFNVAFV